MLFKNFLYKIYNHTRRQIQKRLGFATLGVRAIVINQFDEVLLVRHSYESGWFLPGGGVDRNEPIYTAVKRELVEEVGIQVIEEPKLFSVYVNKMLGAADYPFVFIVNKFTQIDYDSPEISEVAWFKSHQLPDKISPGSKRRLHEYFNKVSPSEKW